MRRRSLLLPALALLAGCEPQLTVDLTDGPTDDATEVVLAIRRVALLTEGGDVKTFALDNDTPVDLMQFRNGETYRLLSEADPGEERYVGIALDFETDGSFLTLAGGGQEDIHTPTTRDFAPIDLSFGETDEFRLVLDLNLRFSLVDNGTDYDLEPVWRAVRPGDSGTVTGSVAAAIVEDTACENGRPTTEGVAVYVFEGDNATPADYVGQPTLIDADDVEANAGGTAYVYVLDFLPPGDYTIALTCQADADAPDTDDAVTFVADANVTVTEGEVTTFDFQ
jgi:hypothetical protein